jgi:tryptophan-rich sensory protein
MAVGFVATTKKIVVNSEGQREFRNVKVSPITPFKQQIPTFWGILWAFGAYLRE